MTAIATRPGPANVTENTAGHVQALPTGVVDVEVVVPVYNEAAGLASSIHRLAAFLGSDAFPFTWKITIADNASVDATWRCAVDLTYELDGVDAVHLDAKGRGRALKQVWTASTARVVAYMDVDLSTGLNGLLPLVAPLLSGHSDMAIGTRLARSSRVVRGPKRELISRSYNLILRTTLQAQFSDAQCGFKALRTDAAQALLPHVEDTAWFFDTELLVLAERSGLRIAEVPVDWVDDPDSRVDIVATAVADLKGVARMVRGISTGALPLRELRQQLGRNPLDFAAVPGVSPSLATQSVRFAAVGVLSTIAYLALFLLLHAPLGAQVANLVALLVTAVANTSINRRFTFGVRGPGAARHQVQGLVVFALGLALTSGSLHLLASLAPHAARATEISVLILANLAATVLRFVMFRIWVFTRKENA